MMTASLSFEEKMIPADLKTLPHWVCWKAILNGGRVEKIPVCAQSGRNASSTDPETWTDYVTAVMKAYTAENLGLGFVFAQTAGIVGIDLDKCRDATTGTLEPWAQDIVTEIDSYTEISPSGTGVHIFVRGGLPPGRMKKGHIEAYQQGRFFTITGRHLEGTPMTIEHRTGKLIDFHARHLADSLPSERLVHATPPATVCLSDEDILAKCRTARNAAKFDALWRGDTNGYPSRSEADLALISVLVFYTQDAAQLDRLYRQCGLRRDKWDHRHGEQTYGAITIQKALANVREIYSPHRTNGPASRLSAMSVWPEIQSVKPELAEEWPVLNQAALTGLAGEVVRLFEPHTEADPVALLVSFLSEVGAMVGRAPHLILDGGYHPVIFWPVIVGRSSKSRKGTADKRIESFCQLADMAWTRGEYRGTLSSGEGLAFAVRDRQYKEEPVREQGKPTGETRQVLVDSGVEDKRLFLVQSEFGAVLRVMERDGNSLSGVLRDSWDGRDLAPMTKGNRIRATAPHIGIVGHVTKDELLRNLTSTEACNGFGNRFVWFVVQRSKELPFPSSPDQDAVNELACRLKAALQAGRTMSTFSLSDCARDAWKALYHHLSAERPGMVGDLLGRAEAQVMRVAALFALLDGQSVIESQHLASACALWSYAEASTKYIFGDSTGDPNADQILRALRAAGELTDTELSGVFGRNISAARLNQAKALLVRSGLAHDATISTDVPGRPKTVWRPGTKKTNLTN